MLRKSPKAANIASTACNSWGLKLGLSGSANLAYLQQPEEVGKCQVAAAWQRPLATCKTSKSAYNMTLNIYSKHLYFKSRFIE